MTKPEIKHWMVLYTRSRWEKKVNQLLNEQNIESYCPLVKRNRKWVDRNKIIEVPLFNSYVFVFARHSDLDKILQTSGVVTYVTYSGKPATINKTEIENIRSIVKKYSDLETIALNHINVGDEVQIKDGPLLNQSGEIQQIHGKSVVMVIKNLNCAITVKINRQEILS